MNTPQQIEWIEKILTCLRDWHDPILKTELIVLVARSNYSYLVGLLDGLCFAGYVAYSHSETDSRLCWVTITRAGLAHLNDDDFPY